MRISEVLSHFKRVFRDAQAGKVSKRSDTGPMSEYMRVRNTCCDDWHCVYKRCSDDSTRQEKLTREQLTDWMTTSMGVPDAAKQLESVWSTIDTSGDGLVRALVAVFFACIKFSKIACVFVNVQVSFEEWMSFLQPTSQWARLLFVGSSGSVPALSIEEMGEFDAMLSRVDELGAYAASKRVRLMIDAEQT